MDVHQLAQKLADLSTADRLSHAIEIKWAQTNEKSCKSFLHLFFKIILEQKSQDAKFDLLFLTPQVKKTSLNTNLKTIDAIQEKVDECFADPSTHYKVQDLESLDSFLQHSPLVLKKKWAIFFHTELITDIVANKLLKTVETPLLPVSFLFLTFSHQEIIPTLKSRLQSFTLNTYKPISNHKILYVDYLRKHLNVSAPLPDNAQDFADVAHLFNIQEELCFLSTTVDYITEQVHLLPANVTVNFLDKYKWYLESQKLHLPKKERVLYLVSELFKS